MGGWGTCVKGSGDACVEMMGDNAEFDGVRSCRCRAGFVNVDGQCVPGSGELCQGLVGPDARFDGLRSCVCVPGYVSSVTGTCSKGSDEGCRTVRGSKGVFDGVNRCTCSAGYVASSSGLCVAEARLVGVLHADAGGREHSDGSARAGLAHLAVKEAGRAVQRVG